MRSFSKREGNNHDIIKVQRITSKPTRRPSLRPISVRTPPRALRKYMTQNEINSAKNKLKKSIPSGNLKMIAPGQRALIQLSNRWMPTDFPQNRKYNRSHSKPKPNSNTLVQNAGKFSFSNQLKEVGFTLQPGGKSTTVLGGVTKQNKKANNFNKKANSNSNNLTTNSWRNTMRMITPKRMLLSLCYIAEDTQNLAKDLRKACRRKFFSSRARRNSHTT
jgi:hypothetical protein